MMKNKNKKKQSRSGAGSVKLLGFVKKAAFYSLPYLLTLTAAGLLLGGVVAYAVDSPVFQLAEVNLLNAGTLTPQQAFQFCDLKPGENMLQLDLVGVQQTIRRKHPEFKEVRVRRLLPNGLEITLKRRTPVAQVVFSRYVQIDKEMVILPGSGTAPFRNLTILRGAKGSSQGLWVGMTLKDPIAQRALKLTDLIKRSGVLRNHALTSIDIGDPKNISLYVDQTLEIKLGGNHLIERLKILDQTLKTIELDASKIRYIDLRFDDVVIGPR